LDAAGGVGIFNANHRLAVGAGNSSAFAPLSAVGVRGNMAVGTNFAQTAVPTDGAIFEGNVGVGTDNPQARLHVAGAVNFTGLRTQENATSPHVIGGFSGNTVGANIRGATIGGGAAATTVNSVQEDFGTVGGGRNNTVTAVNATVGGGSGNTASGDNGSTVGGGIDNRASGLRATVGGGRLNVATGASATVGGGSENRASGNYATVPGGSSNMADGNYSFAAGQRAQALHDGSFVWSDDTTIDPDADAQCVEATRVNVSAAFFLSIENHETGYLAHRAYKVAYGDLPNKPVPLTLQEYLAGGRSIGDGVQVGWATGGGGSIRTGRPSSTSSSGPSASPRSTRRGWTTGPSWTL
ncbi:MAG TPA: hypothetical protein VF064_03355, partial [Pyrinomonadaceae bacterium]